MPTFLPKRLLSVFHKRAFRRSILGLAVFLLLYGVFGYFVLPGIIKSQTQQLISEKLHRQTVIGAVEFNPYTLALTMRDVKLMEAEGGTVFAAFDTLLIDLSSESIVRLAPVVQQLHLTKPSVRLVRENANQYNIDDILALIATQPPSPEPARFSINNIQVENGRIEFDDRPAGKIHAVADLKLGIPFVSSLPSQVQIFVEPLLSAKVNDTPLLIKGKARPFAEPKDAVVELNLDDFDLTSFLTYLPFKPQFKVPSAKLDAHLTASFVQPDGKAPALTLNGDAALKALQVTDPDDKPVLKLPELSLTLRGMNVFSNRLELTRIALNGLEADIARGSDGKLSVMRFLPDSAPARTAPATQTTAPMLALSELQIQNATLRYADENPARPMRAGVEKFDLAVRDVKVDMRGKKVNVGEIVSNRANLLLQQNKAASPATSSGASKDAPAESGGAYAIDIGRINIDNWSARLEDRSQPQPAVTVVDTLALSMQKLSTASAEPGRIDVKATVNKTGLLAVGGNLGITPLQTDLAINAKDVDLLPLQPYITDMVNLRLTRASLSADGKFLLNDGKGSFKGNVSVGNLATVDKVSGSSFLRWKSLSFDGLDVRLQPFSLAADNVAINDFFARVIIDPAGRINLQDVARSHPEERKSLTDETARSSASSASAPTTKPAQTALPPIAIRKLSLEGGTVRFTDNFIKPNYSASLVNFGGAVTGLSSDAASNAKVDLHGEVNNAPLTVVGQVNPLKGDLSLDLNAKVRGMELAPLSAYSGRYVGYGIEKGKLSFDVTYRVQDRKLSAENRLILEQLTFGDKIDSPGAADLPVQFAVALLSDRNGVIDINLPVGGSLDDPQFSIGAIIFKAIGNAIVKAVTQPFTLLGSLFGGGAELSSVDFDAGRSTISDTGVEKLQSLAKALTDRPGLKLEITGRADPETDRNGLKRVSIERKVRTQKIRDLTDGGANVAPGSVTVNASEYPTLLARVYKNEKFEKPRNVIGMAKSLPVEEMEKLMIEHADIDEDDLIALGNQRAQAAKNWLTKNGKVSDERIFILASRIGKRDTRDAGQSSNKVDFSLR